MHLCPPSAPEGVSATQLTGGAGVVLFVSPTDDAGLVLDVVVSGGSTVADRGPIITPPPPTASTSGEVNSVLLVDASATLAAVTMRRLAWKSASAMASGDVVARALVHLNEYGTVEEWPPLSLASVLATTNLVRAHGLDYNSDIAFIEALDGYVWSLVGCCVRG